MKAPWERKTLWNSACFAPAVPFIALAITAVAAGVSTYGAVSSANAQSAAAKRNADYQAQVARNNATLADRAATHAEQAGEQEANQKALETKQLRARQNATLAGNGIDLSFGTPLDILGDTTAYGELDQANARYNAKLAADNYRAQGGQFTGQANLYDASAQGGSGAAGIAAGGIFDGLGSVADKWYKLNNSGALDIFGSDTSAATNQFGNTANNVSGMYASI